MKLRYEINYEFPDQIGYNAFLDQKCEGDIVWYSADNKMVVEEGLKPGWSYSSNLPNERVDGEGFETFEQAVEEFEKALFTN